MSEQNYNTSKDSDNIEGELCYDGWGEPRGGKDVSKGGNTRLGGVGVWSGVCVEDWERIIVRGTVQYSSGGTENNEGTSGHEP